jgi:hypothetical protein
MSELKLTTEFKDVHIWSDKDGGIDVTRFCDGHVTDILVQDIDGKTDVITITHNSSSILDDLVHSTTIFLSRDEIGRLYDKLGDFLYGYQNLPE